MTKTGAGTWTLSGANTYSGLTTVSNGTLRLGNAAALGTTAGATAVDAGATLDLNGSAVGAEAVTLSGSLANNAVTGASLSGVVTLGADASVGGSGSLTLSGKVTGGFRLTKVGAGTLTLSDASNDHSLTTVANGTLRVGADGVLGSGAVTLSGGTLDVDGRTLANDLVLSGGGITGVATLSGILSGTGGLAKSSAGLLTLSGTNTYSGATSVTNGTLAVTGSLHADSAVSVGTNAILSVSGNVAGTVGLSGGATLTGTGSVGATTLADGAILSVADASAGGLTLSGLTLQGGASFRVGGLSSSTSAFTVTGAISQADLSQKVVFTLEGLLTNGTYRLLTIDGAASLDLSGFGTPLAPLKGTRQTVTLGESLVVDGSTQVLELTVGGVTPYWNGNVAGGKFSGSSNWRASAAADSAAADFLANDDLVLDDTATGTTVIDVDGAFAPTSLTFNNAAKDYELTGTGSLSGSLAKNGAGILVLSNGNAFSAAAVNNGILRLNAEGALDGAAVTLSGGTLDLNDQATSASIALSGGALAGNGTVAGIISGSGGLSKSAPGTLTLTASNTYSGATTVSAGILALGNATDTLSDTGAVTVSGGELALGSSNDTVGAVTISSGSITGTGTLTGSSYAVSGGTIGAVLGGSGVGLTKTGSGSATLSAANTYTGATTVSNGTLVLDAGASVAGNIALNGTGALQLSGQTLANAIAFGGGSVSGTGTLSGAMSGASALKKSDAGTITLTGDHALASGISVTGGTLASDGTLGGGTYAGGIAVSSDATFAVTSTSNQTLSGVVSGAGSLNKSGSGTLTLGGSGANTFTGDVAITGGKLVVGAASGTAQSSNPTQSALGNATTAGRTVTVDGAGAVLEFGVADALGAFGYRTPVTLVARNGGVITRAAGAFNSLGDVRLEEGGILRASQGQNATVNSFSINGDVTVSGTNAGGTIDALAGTNNGIHLHSRGFSGTVSFTVGDTLADDDLVVSANLLNPVQVVYAGYNATGTTAAIEKLGEGTMVLAAANSYTGGTRLSDGVLRVGDNAALGTGSVTFAGGVLDLDGFTLANNLSVTAGGILGSGTLSGVLSGSGLLVVGNAGALTFSGNNAGFSGSIEILAGSLVAGNANAFGTSAITLSGGTLDLAGNAIGNTIIFSGGSIINAPVAPAVTIQGEVSAADINALPGTSVTLGTGAVVDVSGLTKGVVITGTPSLTGLASFNGNLAVAGALDLSSPGNRPAGATLELRDGGSIDFGATAFAGPITYKGGAVIGAFQGDLNVSGLGVSITGANIASGRLVVDNGHSVALDDPFFAGEVVLTGGEIASGLSSFSGTIALADGSLNLTASGNATAATIVVDNAGLLAGVGEVGGAVVKDGGVIAPPEETPDPIGDIISGMGIGGDAPPDPQPRAPTPDADKARPPEEIPF